MRTADGKHSWPAAWWWLLAAMLAAGAAVCCWLVARNPHYTAAHREAAAWTSLLVIVALGVNAHVVLLSYQYRHHGKNPPVKPSGGDSQQTVRFRRRGLKAAVIGTDGRASTSKGQVVLWTVAVIAGLVDLLLLTRAVPGGALFTDAVTKNWHPEYLVLLGLPIAAATIAKVAVSTSNNGQGPVPKATAQQLATAQHAVATTPPAAAAIHAALAGNPAALALILPRTRVYTREPVSAGARGFGQGIAEMLTDDAGEVAWADMQYVAFTLMTVISYAAQLLANPSSGLPPVPAALLTLMGVSATGYAANKALETRGNAVSPS